MKVNLKYIKGFTLATLFTIIFGQGIWIYNMYVSYQYELILSIDKSLESAVFAESSDRTEQIGGIVSFSFNENNQDTSRFIQKTITAADTSFQVQIDRYDPHSTSKVIQFMIKDILPLNVNKLDTIFRRELSSNGKYIIQDTYIEYIDLKTNKILNSNSINKQNFSHYVASQTLPIDIFNSLGVKAYVKSSVFNVLGMMLFQLILSITLILISILSLIYMAKTIIIQRKEEKLRQSAINAMTHEFKRPISSAVMQTALIPYYLNKNDKEKVCRYADNALLELNKLTAYTERIQQISNNDKKSIYLDKTSIEIIPFFESLKEKYTHSDTKQISFKLDIQTQRINMNVDFLHFSNVMDNLIENALKYSKDNGVNILIRVSDSNNNLRISVKDDGIGISQTDRRYIFDKFYRSKSKSTQNQVGFGLGLTYVKMIVEGHLGKIEVNSEIGVGSEFIIIIPVE